MTKTKPPYCTNLHIFNGWNLHTHLLCHFMFTLLLFPTFSEAAEKASATLINEIQGVYKTRFMNRIISTDERFESENVIEIVPFENSSVYIRAHLEFSNAHLCSIWGIAKYANGTFVYRESENSSYGAPSCVLRISATKLKLVLSDIDTATGLSTCHMHCGARGSFSNYSISKTSKRKIRYLERLKKSTQYLQAVEEFRNSPSTP